MANVSDVTAVVCTWNAVVSIEECLLSLRKNGVREIIVVDAGSNDGTREVAKQLADRMLDDPGKGLALARNTGIAECQTKYVVNVGADNIMPPESIAKMLKAMSKHGWIGVSAVTLLKDTRGKYFVSSMNLYKMARYVPGERTVIGTPTLFESNVLQKHPYDPAMTHSDDGELCNRLGGMGFRFGIADVEVFEIGFETFGSIIERWSRYGKSDFETFSKYAPQWNWFCKLQSLLYPLRKELVEPFLKIRGLKRIYVLPFLILITLIRYYYWGVHSFTRIDKSKY